MSAPVTTAPADARHLPGSPGYRRIMVAMFAAGLATFVLLYSTQAILPELSQAFDVTPTQATLTVSLATLGLAVALLVAGPLSEVLGRTRLIHVSMWASAAVALACAFAPTWHTLVALRLVEGIVLAGVPAVATAYLREELHSSTQARAAGLYIGGTAIGGMVGRLATAPVADHWGWHRALAVAAGIAILCAAVAALCLPPSRHFEAAPSGWTHLRRMTRAALSDPVLLCLYALGACGMGALVAVFNTLGYRLTEAPFSLALGVVSLVYLVYPLGSASSIVSGRVADRRGRRAVVPVGCAVALVGVALTVSSALAVVVVGVAALTVGFFCMHGLASGWVTARAHAAGVSTGQAASFYLVAYYVGSSVFGNVGSTAWTHAGWAGVAGLAGGLLLVGAGLIVAIRRTPAIG